MQDSPCCRKEPCLQTTPPCLPWAPWPITTTTVWEEGRTVPPTTGPGGVAGAEPAATDHKGKLARDGAVAQVCKDRIESLKT